MISVNSLPKTVIRQHRGCELNPGPSAPESSTLTTRLPSQPNVPLEVECMSHDQTEYGTEFLIQQLGQMQGKRDTMREDSTTHSLENKKAMN